jgi:hypothetical protein
MPRSRPASIVTSREDPAVKEKTRDASRCADLRAGARVNGGGSGRRTEACPVRLGEAPPTFDGAGDGIRTRGCQLGRLMPYHLATPARRDSTMWTSTSPGMSVDAG